MLYGFPPGKQHPGIHRGGGKVNFLLVSLMMVLVSSRLPAGHSKNQNPSNASKVKIYNQDKECVDIQKKETQKNSRVPISRFDTSFNTNKDKTFLQHPSTKQGTVDLDLKQKMGRLLFKKVKIEVNSEVFKGILTKAGDISVTLISKQSIYKIPIINIHSITHIPYDS